MCVCVWEGLTRTSLLSVAHTAQIGSSVTCTHSTYSKGVDGHTHTHVLGKVKVQLGRVFNKGMFLHMNNNIFPGLPPPRGHVGQLGGGQT